MFLPFQPFLEVLEDFNWVIWIAHVWAYPLDQKSTQKHFSTLRTSTFKKFSAKAIFFPNRWKSQKKCPKKTRQIQRRAFFPYLNFFRSCFLAIFEISFGHISANIWLFGPKLGVLKRTWDFAFDLLKIFEKIFFYGSEIVSTWKKSWFFNVIFRPKIFLWPTSLRKIQNQALHLKEKFFCWFSAFKNVQPKSSSTSRSGRIVITKNLTPKSRMVVSGRGWRWLGGPKMAQNRLSTPKISKNGWCKKRHFRAI